jgi:protease I
MSKIAAILTDWFEDSEYTQPAEAFEKAGHTVMTIGPEAGTTATGKKSGTKVEIQQAVAESRAENFDALLIPGGFSPDKLRADQKAVNFVKAFIQANKPVFAICHAPQLLITADVLRGRTITGFTSIIQDIKNAGANFVDQEVVVDNNLVSSRNPGDLPAFIKECLKKLE